MIPLSKVLRARTKYTFDTANGQPAKLVVTEWRGDNGDTVEVKLPKIIEEALEEAYQRGQENMRRTFRITLGIK